MPNENYIFLSYNIFHGHYHIHVKYMSVIILKHSILFISKIYCTCTFPLKQIKFHKKLHLLSLSYRLSFVNFLVLLGYVLFRQFTGNTYFLHVNIKAAVDRATKMY